MKKFLDVYRNLNVFNLNRLEEIYAEDIRFIDPAHEINGLNRLKEYFANLYQNIEPPRFQFTHYLKNESDGYVQWEMEFSHQKLNKGRSIILPGMSYLRFNAMSLVHFHRDYFDLGKMIYEQLPFLGRVVTGIKRRLGS